MRSTVHRARNGGYTFESPNIPAQGFGRRSCAGRRSRAPRAGLLFFFFHRASASPCGGGSSSDPVHPRGPSTVYEYAASCSCGSAFSQLVAARSGLAGSTTFAGCVLAVLVPLAPRLECTTACGQQRFGTAIFPEGNCFLLGFTEFDVLSLKREGLSGVRSHLG